jgi:hypothetical protein
MTDRGRTIDVRGHVFTLVAVPVGGGAGWVARVGRYAATGGAAQIEGFIRDARSRAHDMNAVASTTATGPTAEDALDRLAADLRAAIEGATRSDAEEIERRAR